MRTERRFLKSSRKSLARCENGGPLAEYVPLMALISISVIFILPELTNKITPIFRQEIVPPVEQSAVPPGNPITITPPRGGDPYEIMQDIPDTAPECELNLGQSSFSGQSVTPGYTWRADFGGGEFTYYVDLDTILGAFDSSCGEIRFDVATHLTVHQPTIWTATGTHNVRVYDHDFGYPVGAPLSLSVVGEAPHSGTTYSGNGVELDNSLSSRARYIAFEFRKPGVHSRTNHVASGWSLRLFGNN